MTETWLIQISLTDQDVSGGEAVEIRHAIEDQIEAAGIGEITGGGTQVDGSAIDFQLKVDDPEAAKTFLDAFLDHCDLKENTSISVAE